MDFGSRIQEKRKEQGLSQEALAEMLGVSRQALGKWESGASFPTLENLVQLARIFHMSLDELITGEEAQKTEEKSMPLEALLARIEENAQKRRLPKWLYAALGILGAAGVALALVLSSRLGEIRRENANLLSRINALASRPYDSALSEQITQQVLAALRASDGMTDAAFAWSIEDVDAGKGTLALSLSARPQTIREGEQVCFVLSPISGSADTLEKPLSFPASLEGGQYLARAELPICGACDVYIQTTDQDGTMQQEYADCLSLRQRVLPSIEVWSGSWRYTWSGDTARIYGSPEVIITAPRLSAAPKPMTLQCRFYIGEELIYKRNYDLQSDFAEGRSSDDGDKPSSQAVYGTESPDASDTAIRLTYYPGLGEAEGEPYSRTEDTAIYWRFILTDTQGGTYEAALRYN